MSLGDDVERLRAFVDRDPEVLEDLDRLSLCFPDEFHTWVGAPPPPDGTPFASTGVEGEFYLRPDGAIVAYVPLADETEVVVGSDLRDFLALGCGVGFVFEPLAYDWESGIVEIVEENWRSGLDDHDLAVLDRLAAEFGVTHYEPTAAAARLTELNGRSGSVS